MAALSAMKISPTPHSLHDETGIGTHSIATKGRSERDGRSDEGLTWTQHTFDDQHQYKLEKIICRGGRGCEVSDIERGITRHISALHMV